MFRLSGLFFVSMLVSVTWGNLARAQGFTPRGSDVGLATRDYLLSRPTVSPYLNLLRVESSLSLPNYQTLVRPALEQRQQAAQQRSSIRQLQSRVTNMQGQGAGRNQREQGFATGHPSRFATYLHYYPGLEILRRR